MSTFHLALAAACLSALLALATTAAVILFRRYRALSFRFSDILDADKELERVRETKAQEEATIAQLRESYEEKRAIYSDLVATVAIYDEEVELAEWGFYKPHFDYGTSEQFKEAIKQVKETQKKMISDKSAVECNTEWRVGDSKAEGRKMTNRSIKLTARAFNNECDAAISNTRWNNAVAMEKRIRKAYETINKLNQPQDIHINPGYLNLKLKELRLTHEHREKKQQEKEELRELRRQEREEKKLREEMDRAIKDEEKYNKLLEKARKQADQASGEQLTKLQGKIEELSNELAEAHEKSERARSMAEQTKRGHVYVISNIGSFGEQVYKIGMTRRLDPDDRVKELGDASVPFTFDVHAMIFTDNAPELEGQLHAAFSDRRMNLVNMRKEFFNVELREIREKVEELVPDAEFVESIEARQYNESLAILAQRNEHQPQDALSVYPEAI
ncbi:chromosome partitioning protein ParA [Halovibrio salipaludis]|uniref:Chromosome partitioning protein ParA n=1 Tax=Halovibrio salipaludis TaxID=2032626 RepID=A0A2A2F885_9GAMM|nr:DUF4041 domain-containing protein [Halovibrio salipaludis]PAU81128.1 chromosome partitioning protein ParA [Halovibrio salipaludis]